MELLFHKNRNNKKNNRLKIILEKFIHIFLIKNYKLILYLLLQIHIQFNLFRVDG